MGFIQDNMIPIPVQKSLDIVSQGLIADDNQIDFFSISRDITFSGRSGITVVPETRSETPYFGFPV
jgi:hypothetical protein